MNLFHALTVEKAWVQTIDGKVVDHYLNYDINNDFSNHYTFIGVNEQILAIIDPSDDLTETSSGPGFFLIEDQNTKEEVLIELAQTIPLTIR